MQEIIWDVCPTGHPINRIRQTSSFWPKKGLDTNQVLGSERPHSRSALSNSRRQTRLEMGRFHHLKKGLSWCYKSIRVDKRSYIQQFIQQSWSDWIIGGGNNYLPKNTRYNAIAKPLALGGSCIRIHILISCSWLSNYFSEKYMVSWKWSGSFPQEVHLGNNSLAKSSMHLEGLGPGIYSESNSFTC